MNDIFALLTGISIIGGAFFVFAAAVGIVRLPDLFLRMHAATKAGTLGTGLVMLAAVTHFWEMGVVTRVMVTIFFIVLSAPVAAHTIARASYLSGIKLDTQVDELKTYREEQGRIPDIEQKVADSLSSDELADFD